MEHPGSSRHQHQVGPAGGYALVDEPLTARLTDLPPGQSVRIRGSCLDAVGSRFSSWADYEVTADGSVDLSSQPPVAGTYDGVDPYGLWWSMASEPNGVFSVDLDPIVTTVTAEIATEAVTAASFRRLWVGRGVSKVRLTGGGLVGTLFVPEERPAPGVIVLGGSDGGIRSSESIAALLASRGFTAMALAYFGLPGLPDALIEVPVEYFATAASWLVRQDVVVRGGVGVVGTSRGGELALLLGSCLPEISAVVGFTPSFVLWGGFPPDANVRPAWTLGGRGLPGAACDPAFAEDSRRPVYVTEVFLEALADPAATARATIPVERTDGPIMLITGGDDWIWPSSRLARACMRRLARANHPYADRHLQYPEAGHSVGRPPGLPVPVRVAHPVDGVAYNLGGSEKANAESRADAWPQVLRFLADHVPRRPGGTAEVDRPTRP